MADACHCPGWCIKVDSNACEGAFLVCREVAPQNSKPLKLLLCHKNYAAPASRDDFISTR